MVKLERLHLPLSERGRQMVKALNCLYTEGLAEMVKAERLHQLSAESIAEQFNPIN